MKILLLLSCLFFISCNPSSNPIANNDGSEQENGSGGDLNIAYYEEDVKPLLTTTCMPCHGPGNPKNWMTYKITVEYAHDILASVKHASGFMAMPMGRPKLSEAQIKTIQNWIDNGMPEKAPSSINESPPETPEESERPEPTEEESNQSPEEGLLSVKEVYQNNCTSCHNQTNAFPILAGQNKDYLFRQLKAFRTEERQNPVMNAIAKEHFNNDIFTQDMADYISSLNSCEVANNTDTQVVDDAILDNLKNGQNIYEKQCAHCHSNYFAFPKLEGLNANYLNKSLIDFQKGLRPASMMAAITKNLTNEDINDLAIYIESLNGCTN